MQEGACKNVSCTRGVYGAGWYARCLMHFFAIIGQRAFFTTGHDEYLVKPISKQNLLQKIQSIR